MATSLFDATFASRRAIRKRISLRSMSRVTAKMFTRVRVRVRVRVLDYVSNTFLNTKNDSFEARCATASSIDAAGTDTGVKRKQFLH